MLSLQFMASSIAKTANKSGIVVQRCSVQSTYRRFSSTVAPPASLPSVTLYQYAICPFCNKAKALLDYAGVPYTAVEVNPLTKAEIKWNKDYKKVPIVKINDTVVNGSDDIVDFLLQDDSVQQNMSFRSARNESSVIDNTNDNIAKPTFSMSNFNNDDAKHWVTFANDELASLLYPNICRTLGDSYTAFGYVNKVPEFSTLQRIAIRTAGSVAMYLAASSVKKKRNIVDERQALEEALQIIEDDGLRNSNSGFLSQEKDPHLGDVAVFGTLRAIEGLPAHDAVILQRQGSTLIPDWYNRMKKKMQK